jgi:hypothetical protein
MAVRTSFGILNVRTAFGWCDHLPTAKASVKLQVSIGIEFFSTIRVNNCLVLVKRHSFFLLAPAGPVSEGTPVSFAKICVRVECHPCNKLHGLPPMLFILNALLILARHRCGTSANDANGSVEFPSPTVFFQGFQNTNPDGGDSARYGHTLIDHQVKKTFRINVGTGKHQARAEHRC